MSLYDVNGNLLIADIQIKDYYESEAEDTISKVRAIQTEPNITLFVITDIHAYFVSGAETLYKDSINNMRYILKEIPCDGIVNLGDTIEGYPLAATAKSYGNLISNTFREANLPYYAIIGNHDDNRYHNNGNAERLDISTRYQVFINPTRKVVCDSTGLNYYIDFPENKIRVVCLNSVSDYTYKYTTDTCTWFSIVALNIPTGYSVLMCTHVAPIGSWNYNNTTPTNSSTITTAINSFKENNDFIGIICGHNHVDDVFSSPYHGITLCCEKFENTNGDPALWPSGAVKPSRTLGTYTEDCWSVCVIRPNSRKMNFIRFGAGLDYEITY